MRMIHICEINKKQYSTSEQIRLNKIVQQITISHPIGESLFIWLNCISDTVCDGATKTSVLNIERKQHDLPFQGICARCTEYFLHPLSGLGM